MISLNTNIPSLIAQRSLNNSTKLLNQAIERMTTGFKINHASDNAANYSITTNMTTKIGAYQVAEDNVSMGLDFISTANNSLDLISDKLSRLRALTEQAVNGTYGEQSLKAMNAEAASLINEIYRTKNNAEYNGNNVYGSNLINEDTIGAQGLEVTASGFMQEVRKRDTSSMISLSSVDETQILAKGTYSISSADELAKLARMQNLGKITAGSEFVQGADIDLSAYASGEGWVGIGNNAAGWQSNWFASTYDGNGYKISNLYIDSPSGYKGLFSGTKNAVLKNIALVSGNVETTGVGSINSGSLVGFAVSTLVTNCYSNIDVTNSGTPGSNGWLGPDGGLIGRFDNGEISYCYTTGNVKSNGSGVGGLIGTVSGSVTNCFATGDVEAAGYGGGLIANASGEIYNCHATGNVYISGSTSEQAGGLLGCGNKLSVIENCYATGNIYGQLFSGGLVGVLRNNTTTSVVTNCFATGNVETTGQTTSGFIGTIENQNAEITNCYSTGNISAKASYAGGLIGRTYNAGVTMSNSYATGNISGASYVGGIAGYLPSSSKTISITNCYTAGDVSGSGRYVDNLIGYKSGSINTEKLSVVNSASEVPFSFDKNYITLQVGINGNESGMITMESSFKLGNLKQLLCFGINNSSNLDMLDSLISSVSAKQTDFGAVQNRLESAAEEIATQYDNLVSSRSTLRDADIAEVSSEYIRQQILQQASATLLATANQSPALALQLL